MSTNDKVVRSPIQRLALSIVRREMHEYDALGRTPRYRVERKVVSALDAIEQEHLSHHEHGTRSCAHGFALHTPCKECERSEADCEAYRVAASQRIKELLKQLGE